MSIYFKDEYNNYDSKLTENSSLEQEVINLQNKANSLSNAINRLKNQINSSRWKEKGCTEIKTTTLEIMDKKIRTFIENIENNLLQAVQIIKEQLLPKLEELKGLEKSQNTTQQQKLSEEIEKIILKIKQLNEMKDINYYIKAATLDGIDDQTIAKDIKIISMQKYGVTPAIPKINNEKNKKLSEVQKIVESKSDNSEKLAILKKIIANSAIKNPSKVANPSKISTATSTIVPGKTTIWNTLGSTWTIVDTKIDVGSYVSTAYNKGIRQNSNTARYGNLCMAFSYVHASNLYNGSTSDNAESAYNWAHASEFKDVLSDNKQDILNAIYNEIMNGRPCVVQVNGNKNGTSRHFATVVGFKDTVTSASKLTEDDLLIIDSWDCKVERMDTESSRFLTNGKQTGNGYTGYYLRILKNP